MGRARKDIPTLRFGNKIYPEDLAIGNPWANYLYVDEDNGSDSANNGSAVDKAVATLEQAISNAGRGDVIFMRARAMATGATDPVSYTENAIITADKDCLSIIGVATGRTQGGLPQLKVGATTTQAVITVRAPGCYIANLGINGIDATGGGIVLDDNGSTKTAFGTTIENCHFKNCVGTTATDARTGGAIKLAGAPWQVLIKGNRFYKNVGDILSTHAYSDFQDVVIEDNIFSGQAANTDCNIYTVAGGAGNLGLIIKDNVFPQLPAISSGAVKRYIYATGCTGMVVGNYFGCQTSSTGTPLTFKVAGTGAEIPTTLHMAGNYGQSITAGAQGEVTIA